MIDNTPVQEKAVLVSVITRDQTAGQVNEYLDELSFLLETAGGIEVGRLCQQLDVPSTKTYIGTGKVLELKQLVENSEADMVIFDDELSPAQIRNLEQELQCRILDRTSLILDIFAAHAQTANAKIQVELAQCQYMLPRLAGMWTHLERQRGGIGMRGPGETEIETDRRILRNKISFLKEQLKKIDMQQSVQRTNRKGMHRIALVGYTNVGKSTLLNLLTKSDILAENKLFATLDTTVRKLVIENNPFLLSDTVGFIRKLPTMLIESFKSTLNEVRESDLLLHVVDISHPDYEQQIETVKKTLNDIGAANKSTILVFNKIDALVEEHSLENLKNMWFAKENTPCVFISAANRINIDELKRLILQSYNIQSYSDLSEENY